MLAFNGKSQIYAHLLLMQSCAVGIGFISILFVFADPRLHAQQGEA